MRPLSDFDNQILVTIAKQAKARYYADPPLNDERVASALRNLNAHGMLRRAGAKWWLMRPTEKALLHIENRKRGKAYLAAPKTCHQPSV